MYACKQSWLDYSLFFCPDQKPDDGRVWLVIMNDNWSHYWGAYWMLQADRVTSSPNTHYSCDQQNLSLIFGSDKEPKKSLCHEIASPLGEIASP